jgi:hypothetical protein
MVVVSDKPIRVFGIRVVVEASRVRERNCRDDVIPQSLVSRPNLFVGDVMASRVHAEPDPGHGEVNRN